MSSRWFRGESCACLVLECVEPSPKNPLTQQTDAVRWHNDTMLTPSVSHSPTMKNISSSMSLRTRRRWDSKATPGRNQRKIDNNWRHITDASFGFDIWRIVITVQIYRKIYTRIDLKWTQYSSSVNVWHFFIVIMTYITVILRRLCKETDTPLLFTVFNKLQTGRIMWTKKLDMLI